MDINIKKLFWMFIIMSALLRMLHPPRITWSAMVPQWCLNGCFGGGVIVQDGG